MPSDRVDTLLHAILESAVGQRALPAPLLPDTALLGAIPELDSMAVLAVLTQIEEDFGLSIADDEVSADIFLTYGDLAAFVRARLG